jgi:hypothetical protein
MTDYYTVGALRQQVIGTTRRGSEHGLLTCQVPRDLRIVNARYEAVVVSFDFHSTSFCAGVSAQPAPTGARK